MKQKNSLKVFIIAFVLISLIVIPVYAGGPIRVNIDELYLSDYRGQDGVVLSMTITGTTEGNVWGTGIYSDDSDIPKAAVHANVVKLGETKTVEITIMPGQSSYVGSTKNGIESYDYVEWEGSFKFNDAENVDVPTNPTLPPTNTDEDISSEVFSEGVIMSWNSQGALGYRIFRSTIEEELGVSVTDFYITSNSYADVNVEPNTTYYYTIKLVLVEADPLNGVKEVLGDVIGRYKITTGSNIIKTENVKNFIVLQIDNPIMSVNGKAQEIDPGRGTTPIIVSSRSMVPIRAIVEAMGGTIGWENSSQQITLTANGNTVKMWIGKKEITVNGTTQTIDVAPLIQNERTFVPVRFSAENLNAKVDWINTTKEAIITYDSKQETSVSPEVPVIKPEITPEINPEVIPETKPETSIDTGTSQNSVPNQPVFFMEDQFNLSNNEAQVNFRLKRPITLGEYTGFKVYFTEDGKSEVFEFSDDAFSYSEEIGKTVDISITTVNGTAESTPQNLTFTLMDKIVGDTIWSERQTDDLFGSPCWYGLSWKAVDGASQYIVYVSKDIKSYNNFINYRDLTGFSSITVTDTSFSTKAGTDLPADIVNATWGESRYVVVFPVNADGVRGPFPKYFQITMTGVSSPAHY